ncbi:MAG: hypothetical protein AAF789_01120 [Bacteroidota bacterium]
MYAGFLLAAYSVVGNDVIQTLGTFLSSNQQRSWWVLALFASSILTVVLLYGWQVNGGDVSYGRLLGEGGFENPKYKDPVDIVGFGWPYLLPPLILLFITRIGIPVSTSFMILTFFNPKNLNDMVIKSMSGYLVAFFAAILLYFIIAKNVEKKWNESDLSVKDRKIWTVLQWCSTGFLWSQWLIQDFANIYVFLPRQISLLTLSFSIVSFWLLIGYIFYSKGGAIQSIVLAKTNTTDIRSATVIDLSFAVILFFFKELNKIPMSTTWVFLGLLAGREIGIKYFAYRSFNSSTLQDLGRDLAKVFFGLLISIALVFLVRWLVNL